MLLPLTYTVTWQGTKQGPKPDTASFTVKRDGSVVVDGQAAAQLAVGAVPTVEVLAR